MCFRADWTRDHQIWSYRDRIKAKITFFHEFHERIMLVFQKTAIIFQNLNYFSLLALPDNSRDPPDFPTYLKSNSKKMFFEKKCYVFNTELSIR